MIHDGRSNTHIETTLTSWHGFGNTLMFSLWRYSFVFDKLPKVQNYLGNIRSFRVDALKKQARQAGYLL